MLRQFGDFVNQKAQQNNKNFTSGGKSITSRDLMERRLSRNAHTLLKGWWRKLNREQQKLVPLESFLRNPHTFLENCNPSDVRVLNEILRMYFQYGQVYCSQRYLARKCGVCRKTVYSNLERLEQYGLAGRVYRGVMTTNLYYITPLFHEPEVQRACQGVLRALRTLGLSLLFLISSSISWCYTQAHHRDIYLESYRTTTGLHRAATHQPEIGDGPVHNFERLKQRTADETAALLRIASQCTTGSSVLVKEKIRTLVMEANKVTFQQMKYAVQYIAKKGYEDISKGLPLTPKGMVKLDVFSTDVLRQVYKEYCQMTGTLDDPWRWFYNRCLEVSEEQQDPPVFKKMYEMLDALGLSYDDAGVITHTVPSSTKKAHVLPKNGAAVQQTCQRPDRAAPTQRQAEAPSQPCQNTHGVNTQDTQKPTEHPRASKTPWRQREQQSEETRQQKIQQAITNYLHLRETQPGLAAQLYATMPPEVRMELQRQQQQSITNDDKE